MRGKHASLRAVTLMEFFKFSTMHDNIALDDRDGDRSLRFN